jgi:predicted dehydrogenase
MKKTPLGVGFIGAGDVSILHGNAVSRNPDARLVGIWNRTRERGLARARQFNCRFHESAEELVSDPDIDAVFVLTDLETHLHYAKMAFAAGKHVLCEKPVASSVADAEELRRAAHAAGLLCLPGHNMIYEESLARSHDLIAAGALGKLVSVYVLYNIWHSEERASTLPGIVRQILTHNSYTLMYLAGAPRRVSAFAASLHYERLTQDDIALVNLEMQNGALGHMCASFAADDLSGSPWAYTIKAIGTAGSTSYSYNDWVEAKKGISHSRTFTALQGTFDNEVRQFIRSVRHGEQPPSTLDDAILCQRMIEAIETSIAEGRAVSV